MPRRRPVISEAYRSIQQELHSDPGYGVASRAYAPLVRDLLVEFGHRSISDYGAGKQNLKLALQALGVALDYRPYDPAFPEYGAASTADLVCCIDVLEHVEPELLDNVLDELRDLVTSHGFMTVHTGPASKLLADGRNAHLIQQPRTWWLQRFECRFEVVRVTEAPGGFVVLVGPMPDGSQPRRARPTVSAPAALPTRVPGQMDLHALLSVLSRYLAATPPALRGLNLTAGGDPLDGWLNVGAVSTPQAQMVHNLAHGLSFMPASCMARIYSEDLLHQLPPDAALALLKDARTALVAGGMIRIALPSGAERPPKSAGGAAAPWPTQRPTIYDWETAGALLTAAGFVEVTQETYGTSAHEGLSGLERGAAGSASVILEARKPSNA